MRHIAPPGAPGEADVARAPHVAGAADVARAARRARLRVGVGAATLVGLAGLAIAVVVTMLTPAGSTTTLPAEPQPLATNFGSQEGELGVSGRVWVHVVGAVTSPGIYELPEGSRVVDLVAHAGGFAEGADVSALNLARVLNDAEQVIVPAIGDAPSVPLGATTGATVSLNSADQAALESLPRIGPALAQRILQWRTDHGAFTSVDDLLSVPGIGQTILDGLRDQVTL